jgi:hypothetical protein
MPDLDERFHCAGYRTYIRLIRNFLPRMLQGKRMTSLMKYGPLLAIFLSVTALRADNLSVKPASRTNAQMQAEASRIEAQLKVDYRELLQLQETARKQKDVIKLNCVNSRMIQVKAHMNLAESTAQQLQTAIEANSENRQELFAKLSSSYDAVARLRDEARACVGESEMFRQESGVEVTAPDLPDDPTTESPFDTEIEPPAYASPFY